MAAIKLTKFLGIFPRTSPELLRDSAAQIAYNVQLHTGDLLPYREPKLVQQFSGTGGAQNSTCREGAITLYGLEPYTDNEPVWLTWTTDVEDRKSTRLNSSHVVISYAVFCLKKKKR